MKKTGIPGKAVLFAVLAALVFYSPFLYAEKNRVTIAIAANLVPVMDEIRKEFMAENPGIDVEVIPGASGKLAAQIISGAPYDIFASADMDYPEKIKSLGLAVTGPDVYAEGFLVIFTVRNIDLSKGIAAVKNKQAVRISVANPGTAPYGRAAVNALKKAGLYSEVEKKLVYAGNVSQAAQQIISGTDIGFVARSLMYDRAMSAYKENINWVVIPEKTAPALKQAMVLLQKSTGNGDAVKLYRFILSKKAKTIFRRYGYR